ncbi:MAG: tRNA (adenosine(37)-N6)-threonylcarbamoyltransferase complex dimerization subunit type 1 TsaB [Planctomycetota bacterium]|nr:MAG: tRNA (adenosine(37)-N6)-threonylcarbamoyltransferase complex dimerization subunit type 1 TsaB [Planctomycetota bacterium]
MSRQGGAWLALELSGPLSTLAVSTAEGDLERRFSGERGRALLAEVEALLRDAAVARAALAGIVVGTGPGSYTGLRIACAAARALGFALHTPVVGLSSFQAAALAGPEGEDLHLVLDAYRDEVYHACYRRLGGFPQPRTPPRLLSRGAAAAVVPAGSWLLGDPGLCAAPVRLLAPQLAPRAAALLELLRLGGSLEPATPLYLRAALPRTAARE